MVEGPMRSRALMLALAVLAPPATALPGLPTGPRAEPPTRTKRPLAIDDLYRLDAPATPALSPDGQRLAFSRHWIDPDSVSIETIEREDSPVVAVSALVVGMGGQRTDARLIVEYFFADDGRVDRAVVRAQDQRALDRVLRGWSAGA